MGAMGKQLVMLPALWASQKVNFEDPANQSMLLAAFGTVVFLGFALLKLTLRKVARERDTTRVENPGDGAFMGEKAADGTVSVAQYDTAKLKEFQMQFMMSCGVVTFLHIKWAYTQPILVMCLMQPMQFWGQQVFHVHMRGVPAEGSYKRPWPKEGANNPLAQWAEKKKAEAEAAKKAD